MNTRLRCLDCEQSFPLDTVIYRCVCGGLIEVHHGDLSSLKTHTFDGRLRDSGVWRFREAVLPIADEHIVSHPEGATMLYQRAALNTYAEVDRLYFKHEGENPTGSFKDRGMTVAVSQAKKLGKKTLACASTGNTSASLAAYGAQAGLKTLVFLPQGKVSAAKLAQAVAYGAKCLMVKGDFDAAMHLVQQAADELGIYLVNSINPFRLEGQKTIMWELFQDLGWQVPDWIVVPGGNLGNTSAFGKAIIEAHQVGWIAKRPRILTVQAHGANPFYQGFLEDFKARKRVNADTIATAIRIGDPVNWSKAVRVMRELDGMVCEVSDDEIIHAKRAIDATGVGCEPASAATLAGLKKMRMAGKIRQNETVACILTGHVLKDTDAVYHGSDPRGAYTIVEPSLDHIRREVI